MPDTTTALGPLLKQLSENPQKASLHFEVGRAYLEHGDTANAITHIESAVKMKPEVWRYLEYFGCALIAHGEFAKAVWAFTELCRLLPHDPYDALFLAAARLLSGEKNLGFILRKVQQGKWPYPIASFLKEEIDSNALMTFTLTVTDEEDRLAFTTEAHFYAGIRSFHKKDRAKMHEHFTGCKDMSTYEGIMAQGLLKLNGDFSTR